MDLPPGRPEVLSEVRLDYFVSLLDQLAKVQPRSRADILRDRKDRKRRVLRRSQAQNHDHAHAPQVGPLWRQDHILRILAAAHIHLDQQLPAAAQPAAESQESDFPDPEEPRDPPPAWLERFFQSTSRLLPCTPALLILARWIELLPAGEGPGPQACVPGTGAALFRLLFPEEDVRRRYGMREAVLCKRLIACYGWGDTSDPTSFAHKLRRWQVTDEDGLESVSPGCLGLSLEEILGDLHIDDGHHAGDMTLTQLDSLLTRLAASSHFSSDSIREQHHGLGTTDGGAQELVQAIYANLSPIAAKFVTQIILQDLSPVLYPVPSIDPKTGEPLSAERLLGEYDQGAWTPFKKRQVMRLWHSWMEHAFSVQGFLDKSADLLDGLSSTGVDLWKLRWASPDWRDPILLPSVGSMVESPRCMKSLGPSAAADVFGRKGVVYAETKYDGERMQVHVDLAPMQHGQKPAITIFSKSARDSTQDRAMTHPAMLAALGLDPALALIDEPLVKLRAAIAAAGGQAAPSIERSVILEAEMVAWNEETNCVDEFYKIQSLKKDKMSNGRSSRLANAQNAQEPNTSASPSGEHASSSVVQHPTSSPERDFPADARRLGSRARIDSQATTISNISEPGENHLCLFFFDALYVDGRSLLHESYVERRRLLESIIRPVPGFSAVVESTAVDLGDGSRVGSKELDVGLLRLHHAFAWSRALKAEGLVLKAGDGPYVGGSDDWEAPGGRGWAVVPPNDLDGSGGGGGWRQAWVKLKADYIPTLGDNIDLCIIGASWNADRARELHLPPSVATTFHIGARADGKRRDPSRKPKIYSYFTVEYGLSRRDLRKLNALIDECTIKFDRSMMEEKAHTRLPYTIDSLWHDVRPPHRVFVTPLVVEVCGGGFTKQRGSKAYELRWPRIVKWWRAEERTWERDSVGVNQIQRLAIIAERRSDQATRLRKYDEWMAKLAKSDRVAWPENSLRSQRSLLTDANPDLEESESGEEEVVEEKGSGGLEEEQDSGEHDPRSVLLGRFPPQSAASRTLTPARIASLSKRIEAERIEKNRAMRLKRPSGLTPEAELEKPKRASGPIIRRKPAIWAAGAMRRRAAEVASRAEEDLCDVEMRERELHTIEAGGAGSETVVPRSPRKRVRFNLDNQVRQLPRDEADGNSLQQAVASVVVDPLSSPSPSPCSSPTESGKRSGDSVFLPISRPLAPGTDSLKSLPYLITLRDVFYHRSRVACDPFISDELDRLGLGDYTVGTVDALQAAIVPLTPSISGAEECEVNLQRRLGFLLVNASDPDLLRELRSSLGIATLDKVSRCDDPRRFIDDRLLKKSIRLLHCSALRIIPTLFLLCDLECSGTPKNPRLSGCANTSAPSFPNQAHSALRWKVAAPDARCCSHLSQLADYVL